MTPSQMIITKIRPSLWIPAAEIIWAIITTCFAAANSAKQIYAMRFLIGLAESPFYVGAMTLLGNWYTPRGGVPHGPDQTALIVLRTGDQSIDILLRFVRRKHVFGLPPSRNLFGDERTSWPGGMAMALYHVRDHHGSRCPVGFLCRARQSIRHARVVSQGGGYRAGQVQNGPSESPTFPRSQSQDLQVCFGPAIRLDLCGQLHVSTKT